MKCSKCAFLITFLFQKLICEPSAEEQIQDELKSHAEFISSLVEVEPSVLAESEPIAVIDEEAKEEDADDEKIEEKKEPIFTAIGTIYPLYKTTLASQVTGRVEDVFVNTGDFVKKDQPLAKLDTIFFEIDLAQREAQLLNSKIELKDAEVNLNRMKKLWEKPEGESPSIPQKRFDDAKVKYDQMLIQLKLQIENLKRAKAELKETVILAPFDGVITKRFVDRGEVVTAAPVTKMLEIQHVDTLYVEFAIGQLDLKLIQLGSPIKISIEGAESPEIFAEIGFIHPEIDEATRSVKCRAYLRGKKDLKSGSLAKVEVYAP